MKIIVSHDVDHLYLTEHWRDTFIPGLALRSFRSCFQGHLSIKALVSRFTWRLNRIRELHKFNLDHRIPATWFFGMRTGLNLSYAWRSAKPHIQFLCDQDVEVGLHGMAYDNKELIREEKNRLEDLLNCPVKGIRNHYLRMANCTHSMMNELGFEFDSTQEGLITPSKIGSLHEIPVSVMDVSLAREGIKGPASWLEVSRLKIEQAEQLCLPFFVINFHDVYYAKGWLEFKNWYESFVIELIDRKFEFVDFRTAVLELNASKTSSVVIK